MLANLVQPAKVLFPFFTKSELPAIRSSIPLNSAWHWEPALSQTSFLLKNASPNLTSTGILITTPDAIHRQKPCNHGNGPSYSGEKKVLKIWHGHRNLSALGAAEKGLGKISKKVLSEIAVQAIKKASGLLTLAENLKTDKAFRHVHIVYIYRFVHHGKVESEWKIGHMTNISRSGVDYHPPKDIPYVVKEGINKISNLLKKQLKEDCKNHQ